jgi:hypothetical protein
MSRGDATDVVGIAGNSEVGQEDSLLALVIEMGDHDIGGFDISVQQALLVGVIQRAGNRCDDASNFLDRHSIGISIAQQPSRVEPVDEVHRNPQLAVVLPTIVHTDYVGMPECRSEIGFPVEAGPIFGVGRPVVRKQLLSVATR